MSSPIKLITGLGNYEEKYFNTRHNVGFMWLDHLAESHALTWHKNQHGTGLITKWTHQNEKIILFKPGLLMNINGGPIQQCAHYHRIEPENILVVYDELDLTVGQIKLKQNGGHNGHNGVRDIQHHLQNKNFYKLRIGIDRPSRESVSNYVLGKPNATDTEKLKKTIAFSVKNLYYLLKNQENTYHQKLALWSKDNEE